MFLVGLGGFLGSILRWALSVWMMRMQVQMQGTSFPWGTLTVNMAGSFLLGVLLGLGNTLPPGWRLLLAAGFCGSFTTFSTFSLENIQLIQQGQHSLAFGYIGISLATGLSLAWTGLFLTRTLIEST